MWVQRIRSVEAARSIVTKPKTATEASISDQSLGARVADFRDTVEEWLSEIAQYLENAVDMYTATHFDPKTRRVQPKEMRDEIAQLLKWIKLLREET